MSFQVLAAAATNDPSLKGTSSVRPTAQSLWAMADIPGTTPVLPDGTVGVYVVARAGELAQQHALRGHDAIHLAAAERVRHDTSVMVAGDHELCAAAEALGIAVASTSAEGLGN